MGSDYVPKAKPKPKLPAPTFKYGSNTYLLLAYAKMKNKPFTVEAVRNFNLKYSENSQVTRGIAVLIKNGSVQKVKEDSWMITPVGVQQLLDFAARRSFIAYDRDL